MLSEGKTGAHFCRKRFWTNEGLTQRSFDAATHAIADRGYPGRSRLCQRRPIEGRHRKRAWPRASRREADFLLRLRARRSAPGASRRRDDLPRSTRHSRQSIARRRRGSGNVERQGRRRAGRAAGPTAARKHHCSRAWLGQGAVAVDRQADPGVETARRLYDARIFPRLPEWRLLQFPKARGLRAEGDVGGLLGDQLRFAQLSVQAVAQRASRGRARRRIGRVASRISC